MPLPAILLLARGHFVVAVHRKGDALDVFFPEKGWTRTSFSELAPQLGPFAITVASVAAASPKQTVRPARHAILMATAKAFPPGQFAVYAAALVAAHLMVLVLPTVTGRIIDSSGGFGQAGSLGSAAVIYATVSFLAGLSLIGSGYLAQHINKKICVQLGHSTFAALACKHPRWFENLPADGVRNGVGAVDTVARFLVSSTSGALVGLTSIVVAVAAMVMIAPILLAVSVPLIGITGFVDAFAEGRQTRVSSQLFMAVQRKNRFVGDSLSQLPLFARGGQIDWLRRRYIEAVNVTADADKAVNTRRSVISVVTNLIRALDLLVFSYICSVLIIGGWLTLGDFVAVSAYKVALTQGISTLARILPQLDALAPAIQQSSDLYEGVQTEAAPRDCNKGEECVARMECVSFKYDHGSEEVLRGVSLEIESGQFVVVTGPSGAGKTTIAKLLCGLEFASSGQVSIMGQTPALGMPEVAVVLQSDRLIDGSIRENVVLLDDTIDPSEVLAAINLVGLGNFVSSLPMGLETKIAEGRAGLSAGQRQRILLARAAVLKPKLLILDEATSNIDVALEAEVLAAFRATRAAILLITHRPEAWAGADQLLEVAGGQLRALVYRPSARKAVAPPITAGRAGGSRV